MTHEQAVTMAATVPRSVRDPVCGMSVDAARSPHQSGARGPHLSFLQQSLSRAVRGRALALLDAVQRDRAAANRPPRINGPARCIPRSCVARPAAARSAAWRSNRWRPPRPRRPIPELADMTRRFWIGVALSLPLVALAMTEHFRALLPGGAAVWLQLVLATPVVLWCGLPFFERGWASLVHRHLNMFTLIMLGTGIAYGYSLIAALLPGLFPASFRMPDGNVPVYFEPAAVIVTLVLLGQVLELRARAQTGALSAHCSILLLDRAPHWRRWYRSRCRARVGRCPATA